LEQKCKGRGRIEEKKECKKEEVKEGEQERRFGGARFLRNVGSYKSHTA
jgi:hypothetical protein